MKTSEELIKIIKDNDLQHSLFECYVGSTEDEFPTDYERVDYVCNSDEMFCVIHFVEEDIYLKLTGEYDSYGQCDHDYDNGIQEVKPKQKLITVYE